MYETNPTAKRSNTGDVISPKLFTSSLEDVFKLVTWKCVGNNIHSEYHESWVADDIVVMMEDISTMLRDLNGASKQAYLF